MRFEEIARCCSRLRTRHKPKKQRFDRHTATSLNSLSDPEFKPNATATDRHKPLRRETRESRRTAGELQLHYCTIVQSRVNITALAQSDPAANALHVIGSGLLGDLEWRAQKSAMAIGLHLSLDMVKTQSMRKAAVDLHPRIIAQGWRYSAAAARPGAAESTSSPTCFSNVLKLSRNMRASFFAISS